jgi:enhanced filamentous growth protein 1
MDMHPGSHLSSGPSYTHASPTAPMGHYQYPQPAPMPSASSHYGPPPGYGSYGYPNGVTSPQSVTGPVSQVHTGMNSLPGKLICMDQVVSCPTDGPTAIVGTGPSPQHPYVQTTPTLPAPNQGYPPPQQPFDTTGQIAPPGMKPRVTATLWEDEGSLCFQVEAKGVCVARREGNCPES